MNIVLLGLSHKTAPVEVRERIAFQKKDLVQALKDLIQIDGITEGLIISTCNRVEIIAGAQQPTAGLEKIREFLYAYHGLEPSYLASYLYQYHDSAAIKHVFRVASSLDSLVLGEPQILGQVKEAYALAAEAGSIGGYLHALFHRAFYVAKRVRNETSVGDSAVSISYAAVELARKIFGSLKGKMVLIVGAGKMSELATKHLRRSGAENVLVTNRTYQRAVELAQIFNGQPIPYEELFPTMARVDIVITSTNATEYIIGKTDVHKIIAERKNKPIFFIDIAVPRNIDPEVNKLDNIFCYDIDDLGSVVQANIKERQKEASVGERLIEDETRMFSERLASLDVTPLIVALRGKIEEICHTELNRYLNKSANNNLEQKKELQMMVDRIVNKIAHPLITHMKHPDKNLTQRAEYIETIKKIFKLHEEK